MRRSLELKLLLVRSESGVEMGFPSLPTFLLWAFLVKQNGGLGSPRWSVKSCEWKGAAHKGLKGHLNPETLLLHRGVRHLWIMGLLGRDCLDWMRGRTHDVKRDRTYPFFLSQDLKSAYDLELSLSLSWVLSPCIIISTFISMSPTLSLCWQNRVSLDKTHLPLHHGEDAVKYKRG